MYFIGQVFTSICEYTYHFKSIHHVGEVHRIIKEKNLECMNFLHPEILFTRLTPADMWLHKYLLNVQC